jgi:hypothetical protein
MTMQGFNGSRHHCHHENVKRLQMNSLDCAMTYYQCAGSLQLV